MPPRIRYLCIYLPVSGFPFWWPYSCYPIAHTPWIGEDKDFPLGFLVVWLIANRAGLILWFLPQYWPFHPLVYKLSLSINFGSNSGWWTISKPCITRMLWPFHQFPQFNRCLFAGRGEQFSDEYYRQLRYFLSEGRHIPFCCHILVMKNSHRYQFHCNTSLSIAKPVKDSALKWI